MIRLRWSSSVDNEPFSRRRSSLVACSAFRPTASALTTRPNAPDQVEAKDEIHPIQISDFIRLFGLHFE